MVCLAWTRCSAILRRTPASFTTDPGVPKSSRAAAATRTGDAGAPPAVPAAAPVKASPSVRMLARKLGIDLRTVHGSGPAGRILLEDLHLPAAGTAGGA